MDPSKVSQVRHLYEVEHLSRRQIARQLHMCTKSVAGILTGEDRKRRTIPSSLEPFARLIEQWYQRYPSLRASQNKEPRRKQRGIRRALADDLRRTCGSCSLVV
jgi:hypothetical protein